MNVHGSHETKVSCHRMSLRRTVAVCPQKQLVGALLPCDVAHLDPILVVFVLAESTARSFDTVGRLSHSAG